MREFIEFEKNIIINLKKSYKLNIEEACFAKDWVPFHIILDRTRNIHSYLVFASFSNNNYSGRYFTNPKTFGQDILSLIRTQYSQLDRPLFIITKMSNQVLSCIEGNIVREYILGKSDLNDVKKFISEQSIDFEQVVKSIKSEL